MVAEELLKKGYDNIRSIREYVRVHTGRVIRERRPLHIAKNAGVIFLIPGGVFVAPVYTIYCFVCCGIQRITKIRTKEGELVEKCR